MGKSGDETRSRLLDSAMHVMRLKGYAATSVDDICRAAGVTKGSFFHHFASKEALGLAAAEHFASMAAGLFGSARYRTLADPRDRLLGYVDFRIEILSGPVCEFSCLLGTFAQELYETHPAIRAACDRHMGDHVAELARDAALARELCGNVSWTAESLAYHMQAVLQGSLIFAKVRQGPDVAIDCLRHLRRYLELLFAAAPSTTTTTAREEGVAHVHTDHEPDRG